MNHRFYIVFVKSNLSPTSCKFEVVLLKNSSEVKESSTIIHVPRTRKIQGGTVLSISNKVKIVEPKAFSWNRYYYKSWNWGTWPLITPFPSQLALYSLYITSHKAENTHPDILMSTGKARVSHTFQCWMVKKSLEDARGERYTPLIRGCFFFNRSSLPGSTSKPTLWVSNISQTLHTQQPINSIHKVVVIMKGNDIPPIFWWKHQHHTQNYYVTM